MTTHFQKSNEENYILGDTYIKGGSGFQPGLYMEGVLLNLGMSLTPSRYQFSGLMMINKPLIRPVHP